MALLPHLLFIEDVSVFLNYKPLVTLMKISKYCLILQIGSHYHFIETNPYLVFDRKRAYGMRLNILAGTAVRFEVLAFHPCL